MDSDAYLRDDAADASQTEGEAAAGSRAPPEQGPRAHARGRGISCAAPLAPPPRAAPPPAPCGLPAVSPSMNLQSNELGQLPPSLLPQMERPLGAELGDHSALLRRQGCAILPHVSPVEVLFFPPRETDENSFVFSRNPFLVF